MRKITPKKVLELLERYDLFRYVHCVIQFLIKNGYNFYFVGGTLRDAIISILYKKNFSPQDIDIVVETEDYFNLVKKIKNLNFKDSNTEYIEHSRFLTFSINIYEQNKKLRIDLSLPRKEKYNFSGALPEISYGSIEEDLFRRDFTINSISLRYNKDKNEYYFFDPYCGIQDLLYKKIKVLHNKSFIDDPTRIIRAIRFKSTLDFKIDEDTEKLLVEAIDNGVLNNISKVRLYNEFVYILKKGRNLHQVSRCFVKYNIIKYYTEMSEILKIFLKKSKKIELKQIKDFNSRFYIRLFYLLESTLGKVKLFDKRYLKKVRNLMVKLYINKKDRENVYNAVKIFCGEFRSLNYKSIPLWIKCYSKIFNKKIPSLPITPEEIISLGVDKKYIGKILSYVVNNKIRRLNKNKIFKILSYLKTIEK